MSTLTALAPEPSATVRTIDLTTRHVTASGQTIEIRGRVTGPETAPVEIVLGGISSGRDVVPHNDEAGWWPQQAGTGKPIDPAHTRILSFEFIGQEIAPFPTTRDQAAAILALADLAGIAAFGVIGSSYGGMIALALAELAPHRVTRVLVISAAHCASAMAQAWRSIQRDTVRLALAHGDGAAGLDLARRLAMTTYRTPAELEARFYEPDPESRDAAGVTAYLEARGADYARKESPERFLALSESMDAHKIDVANIDCPVHFVAVAEDRLVPIEQIAEAAGRAPSGRLTVIKSFYGHDAFLKEEAAINEALTAYLGD